MRSTTHASAAAAPPAAPPAAALGSPQLPWQVCWLHVDQLEPDASYQRRYEPAIARRLVQRYIPELLAGVRVSLRDGRYYVKDGWHRVQAARLLGLDVVHCYVEEQTQAEEARAFVRLNSGTKVQSLQRFKAALEARDEPDVLAVNALIEECGFVVDYDMRQRDPHSFWAVSTALDMYRSRQGNNRRTADVFGPERLRRALLLARATWPDARGAGQSVILRALDRLFSLAPGFDRADFARKVGALDPDEVVLTAHRYNRAHGHDTYLWALQELCKAYNKGLRDPGRRLPLPIPVQAQWDDGTDAFESGADETAQGEGHA